MREDLRPGDHLLYRESALGILGRTEGRAALEAFGLDELLTGADPVPDLRPAYAFLEAQGSLGAVTPALGLVGLAGLAGRIGGDGPVLLGSPLGTGGLVGVPGLAPGATVVVDRPGTGLVALAELGAVAHRQVPPVADGYLTVVDAEDLPATTLVPEQDMAVHRDAVLARTRLGAAAELLGVVDRLLDDAVAYARGRYQFGRPVAGYQSIQHLLAWAATERHQLVVLLDAAIGQSASGAADPALCRVVKAVAGRVLHAVTQAATQVTGAIGFTWEHPLTRLHRRGLALDQLAGSSADLVAAIGRQVRIEGAVPELVALRDVT
jgi:hypothetical protein